MMGTQEKAAQNTPERVVRTTTGERRLALVSGRSNPGLAQAIADKLNVELTSSLIKNFADGETHVSIDESIRDADVFVIQSTCRPVNHNYMELFVLIDAISRSSPRSITVILPYYGYSRQDRKARGRESISAALVATLIGASGDVTRVVTLDLHSPQIQGFFPMKKGDHFYATLSLTEWIRDNWLQKQLEAVIVSPDAGGVNRARTFAKKLELPLAVIDKRRPAHNTAEIHHIIGDVEGRVAIMIDDMVDTGGSVVKGAEALMANGATQVYVAATHGLLSGHALKNIRESCITEVAITDSIPHFFDERDAKIKIVSVAPLFADVILRIFYGRPVSDIIGWIGG